MQWQIHCGGDLSTLAGKVNSFFESVSRYWCPWTRVCLLDCPVPMHYNSETVSKFLSKINVNKAIGPDDIPSWIIRDHALTLAHPISTIFNASIREGYLPQFGDLLSLFSSQRLTLRI